jgi:hypothetical protein
VSRAEPLPVRTAGGLRSAFRAAAVDFYYQSIRLVPANVAWGLALLVVLAIAIVADPGLTMVVVPLLAIPYVGIVRLAVQAARGRDVVLSDLLVAYRRFGLIAVLIGGIATVFAFVLASNVVIGAAIGGPLGWVFGTLAFSGLFVTWVVGFPAWVLLVDPEREERSVRERLRLAVLLSVAAPGRLAALAVVLAIVLFVSAVAFAALLTISVAFAALVAARYILPLADRFEAWLDSPGERPLHP